MFMKIAYIPMWLYTMLCYANDYGDGLDLREGFCYTVELCQGVFVTIHVYYSAWGGCVYLNMALGTYGIIVNT